MPFRARLAVAALVATVGIATVSSTSSGSAGSERTSSARPNLEIGWILDPPSVLSRGTSFSAAALVENAGKATASRSRTTFYLTKQLRPASRDHEIGRISTRSLKAGASVVRDVRVRIDAKIPAGRYFLYVCADSKQQVRESSERDNCVSSATDLLISDPS